VAVGAASGASSTPVVVPVSHGVAGGVENVPGTGVGALAGVACSDGGPCYAVGWNSGALIVPIINGGVGIARNVAGLSRLSQLHGVACPPAAQIPQAPQPCVAVGLSGATGPGIVVAIGGVSGPWKARDKIAAAHDFVPAVGNAITYCTPHAVGLGLLGVGTLMIGTGGQLAIAGQITAYLTAPFCYATMFRVLRDLRRFNDPPNSNFHQLASPGAVTPILPPSCRRWHGSLLAFCSKLVRAETKWAGQAERVAAIDQALEVTMARESAAIAANDQTAVDLQDAHIPKLERQERAAAAAEAAAGRTVAQNLGAHHVRWRATKAQNRQTIAAVERALAKLGVSTRTLKQLAGRTLTPRAVNILAALRRG
jgi:hypothetical protein